MSGPAEQADAPPPRRSPRRNPRRARQAPDPRREAGAPGACGDPPGEPGGRRDAPELVRQPELPLRPDPGARRGPRDDRRGPLPDERQGRIQGPPLLRPGPGPGDLLGSLLRGPDGNRRAPAGPLLPGPARRRRDDRLRRLVGSRPAGPDPDAARLAGRRGVRAGLRRSGGRHGGPGHAAAALLDAALLARLRRHAGLPGLRDPPPRASRGPNGCCSSGRPAWRSATR